MLKIKHSGRASLSVAVIVTLAMLFAACTSFQWITPVPSAETPGVAAEAAVAEPAPETTVVTPTTEANSEVTPKAVAETEGAEEEATNAESAEEAGELEPASSLPSPITHRLDRREECSDCHTVNSSRNCLPADHVNYSDDLYIYCHMP